MKGYLATAFFQVFYKRHECPNNFCEATGPRNDDFGIVMGVRVLNLLGCEHKHNAQYEKSPSLSASSVWSPPPPFFASISNYQYLSPPLSLLPRVPQL